MKEGKHMSRKFFADVCPELVKEWSDKNLMHSQRSHCAMIYVRPQGRSPCGSDDYLPCLGISFSASAESSVCPLTEAV